MTEVISLVYSNTACAIIAISIIVILSFMFDPKYFKYFMALAFTCTVLLSFCIFYYIGSYKSTEEDADLKADIAKQDDSGYILNIGIEWKRKIQIFGFNGNEDALIVRYDPKRFQIISSDSNYDSKKLGETFLKLPDEFKYSKIKGNELEVKFDVKDGEAYSEKILLKNIKPGGAIQVFFIHDYKIPLDTRTYWEKSHTIEFSI